MISIEPLFQSDFARKSVMAKIDWLKTELQTRYNGKFYSLNPSWKDEVRIKENEIFIYESDSDKLFVKGRYLGGLIYDSTVWADSAKT